MIIRTTAEELNLIPNIFLGEEAGNFGFAHAELVAAFKTAKLRPVTSAAGLMEAFLSGFRGYIPDGEFFTEAHPDCPYFDGEFSYGDYLKIYGGWPPNDNWLLEKE